MKERGTYANHGESVGPLGIPVDEDSGHDEDHETEEDLDSAHHHHPNRRLLDVPLLRALRNCRWGSILLLWDGGVGHCLTRATRWSERSPAGGMCGSEGCGLVPERERGIRPFYTVGLLWGSGPGRKFQRAKRPPPHSRASCPTPTPGQVGAGKAEFLQKRVRKPKGETGHALAPSAALWMQPCAPQQQRRRETTGWCPPWGDSCHRAETIILNYLAPRLTCVQAAFPILSKSKPAVLAFLPSQRHGPGLELRPGPSRTSSSSLEPV